MDSYFMDQVIDSFISDGWWGDGGYDGPSFDYNPNYYHHSVKFTLVRETEKAYLLESRQGEFWCPKSLLRKVKIKGDKLTAILWNGFVPEFKKPEKPVDVFDAFAEIDKEEAKAEKTRKKIQKKLDKRLKREKRKKKILEFMNQELNDDFFLKWLGL